MPFAMIAGQQERLLALAHAQPCVSGGGIVTLNQIAGFRFAEDSSKVKAVFGRDLFF